MGLFKWILIFGVIGIIIWAFVLPSGTLIGEQTYDVEVSATVTHGILSLPQTFNLYDVNYKVLGTSRNFNLNDILGIGTYTGSFEFCIDDRCQWNNEELSSITLGESKTSTEVITKVSKGNHTLTVNFYTDKTLRTSQTKEITV